jgi:hypothetical protein
MFASFCKRLECEKVYVVMKELTNIPKKGTMSCRIAGIEGRARSQKYSVKRLVQFVLPRLWLESVKVVVGTCGDAFSKTIDKIDE